MTASVALFLDAAGRFCDCWESREFPFDVSEPAARAIGELYAHTFGPLLRNTLEQEHGATINFQTLRLCGRHLYLRSSFQPVGDDSEFALIMQPATGGQWLQVLCSPEGVRILIQTVASRTKAQIQDGALYIPAGVSAGIGTFGIPLGSAPPFQEPEKAVQLVYEATGVRVSELPTPVHDIYLVATIPHDPSRTFGAFWKVRTERSVEYIDPGSGETKSTDIFWVVLGFSPGLNADRLYIASRPPLLEMWHYSGDGQDSVRLLPREPMSLIPFPIGAH